MAIWNSAFAVFQVSNPPFAADIRPLDNFSWSLLYFQLFCYIREKTGVGIKLYPTCGPFPHLPQGLAEQLVEELPLL